MKDEIKKIVVQVIEDLDIQKLNEDTNLYNLGLDSLNVIKLIILIENKYNIKFDDNDIRLNNWKSINTIQDNINRKIS